MCWSAEASTVVACAGAAGAAITFRRGDAPAIWLTLGYFTLMEMLQIGGYLVVDQCGSAGNRGITLASYLHIAFQPALINAFAMELVPKPVKTRVRQWVYALCAISTVVMLAQLLPIDALGSCLPGSPLCGAEFCTVRGEWHIAWTVPYNGLLVPFETWLGTNLGFPTYILAVFALPLVYGAWRFVLFHILFGPVLAMLLTGDLNEMPAIWCLFSIFIIFVSLSPAIRRGVSATTWWGREVAA